MTTQTIFPGELRNFVSEYADDYYSLRLMFFFAAYPNARFDSKAIFGSLNIKDNQQNLKRALDKLVEDKVADITLESPIPVYRLGEDSTTRSQVMELGKLNYSQRQELLNLTHSSPA